MRRCLRKRFDCPFCLFGAPSQSIRLSIDCSKGCQAFAARTAVVGKRGEERGMRSVIMRQGRMICLIAIGMYLPVCGGIPNWAS